MKKFSLTLFIDSEREREREWKQERTQRKRESEKNRKGEGWIQREKENRKTDWVKLIRSKKLERESEEK